MRSAQSALPRLLCVLISTTCTFASFVSTPTALNSNGSATWSALGNPGAPVAQLFTVVSPNGIAVQGTFAGSTGGTVAQVCPAPACDYAGATGFNSGDFLLWSEDSVGNGSGPLTLAFSTPVRGAGLYLELTAPGVFAATFSEITGAGTLSEFPVSDSFGDPIFLGALDTNADIIALKIGILFCTPSTPGACNSTDFAVDTLELATPIPEPTTSIYALLALGTLGFCHERRRLRKLLPVPRRTLPFVCCAATLALHGPTAQAQDPIPFDSTAEQLFDATNVVKQQQPGLAAIPVGSNQAAANGVTPALPIWRYQVNSPIDGLFYGGYMVGSSPFNRGARSTTIPVLLIPVIATFQNTTSGFTATFDPSGTPDAGCTANQTVMNLVANSPIFQNQDWTLNGTYVGNTQYVDAFQRANFWQYVQNTGNAYHTLLSYTMALPLTIPISYAAPTTAAEVRVGLQGSCTNPSGSGSTNGAGYEGIVDLPTLHAAFVSYISANGVTPDQFPIFILYNVIMSEANQTTLFGGFHFSQAGYPQALTSPGQTYAVADFRTLGTGATDTAVLSHEVAEWMDDPGDYNFAPAWGHIGQETGCSRYLEVGDPLTGTTVASITGTNGFTYHLQELAFFSWFFRTSSIGAGGTFSDNGTLAANPGPVCQ